MALYPAGLWPPPARGRGQGEGSRSVCGTNDSDLANGVERFEQGVFFLRRRDSGSREDARRDESGFSNCVTLAKAGVHGQLLPTYATGKDQPMDYRLCGNDNAVLMGTVSHLRVFASSREQNIQPLFSKHEVW